MKALILGHTGKMGTALMQVLKNEFEVRGETNIHFTNTFHFNEDLVNFYRPDYVFNCIAHIGIDQCEKNAEYAFKVNALYPRWLASLSNAYNFTLVHFSTDAVFSNSAYPIDETQCSKPLSVYGVTKYAGDCLIQSIADRYYIFRLSLLFGPSGNRRQFVEKMLDKYEAEGTLEVANDIIVSPTYSIDVANKISEMIDDKEQYGLYHIANDGKASLYELMNEILDSDDIKPVSYTQFPHVGVKNLYTPLTSINTTNMRSWKQAVKDYRKSL